MSCAINPQKTSCENFQDPNGCFNEAERYWFGIGVDENKQAAIEMYTTAANDGNTLAKARLGRIYFFGWETKKNHHIAAKYFQDVLKNFDDLNCTLFEPIKPITLSIMGFMYQNGLGFEHNEEKAFQYLLRAAKLRYGPAQLKVAVAYLKDTATEKNALEAYAWLKAANEGGYTVATKGIQELESQFSHEQMAKAENLSKIRIENYKAIYIDDVWQQPMKLCI